MSEHTKPEVSFGFTADWFRQASKKAKAMGRLDSAMLWDDGLAHLLHIKAQRDDLLAALKEAKAALEFAVEQGGGPQCEHESGGAVCFCRENSAINSARAAIAKAEAGKVGDEG